MAVYNVKQFTAVHIFGQTMAFQSSLQLQVVHSSMRDVGAYGYGWDCAKDLVELRHDTPAAQEQFMQCMVVYSSSWRFTAVYCSLQRSTEVCSSSNL